MAQLPRKLLYFSAAIWKKAFIYHAKPYFKAGDKFIYNRSSVIPNVFRGTKVYIYTGKKWTSRNVTRWRIGFKFGEFTWNRRIALYKAKQMRKKLKKAAKKR